jgi:hypothetical protein
LPLVLAPGAPRMVSIGINAADVTGAELTLSYDPKAVSISDIRDGGYLSQDGQVIALVQKIDSETGTVRISIERPPGASSISGGGSLATMTLTPGAQKGDATLRITDFKVRNARGTVQAGQPTEVQVTVQ